MATTGTVSINIVGDASSLRRALGSAERDMNGFGSRVSRIGDIMAGVFGANVLDSALRGVVTFFQGAFKEADEALKIQRETERVIESMGNVANVTAKQVENLAEKISNKVAIDDEAIQSGANLLLTFGNIRNEVGKGNDVFDRATKLAVDLSTVFKQDLKSSAVQLGKALNDPIAGLTSLSRIGVQFTEQQKEQIRTLVGANDVLGAQRIILDEITRQVGGAAEAAATPFERLQVRFKNLQEEIGIKLMPALVSIAEWLNTEGLPAVERFVKWWEENWPQIQQTVENVWHVVEPIYRALFEQLEGVVQLIDDLIHGRWAQIFGDLWEIVENAVGLVVAPMISMWRVVDEVVQSIANKIYGVFAPALNFVADVAENVWSRISSAAQSAWSVIEFVLRLYGDYIRRVIDLLNMLGGVAAGAFGAVVNAGQALWSVVDGPLGAMVDVLRAVVRAAERAGQAIRSIPSPGDFIPDIPGAGGGVPFVPGFATGGVVPGPIGMPQLAVVHGGEEVLTPQQRGGGGPLIGSVTIVAPDPESAADALTRRLRTEAFLAGMN